MIELVKRRGELLRVGRQVGDVVAEADGPNKQVLAAAPYTREFLIAVRKAVGVDWDATAVEGGLWLVRPNHDSVVGISVSLYMIA